MFALANVLAIILHARRSHSGHMAKEISRAKECEAARESDARRAGEKERSFPDFHIELLKILSANG